MNTNPFGKSLEDTAAELIAEHQVLLLEKDLDDIDNRGQFVGWVQVKRELG